MNIRTRLTVRFILISAIIILMASILIYLFSASYRVEDFYTRLYNKGYNTAKLLIEVEEINANLLRRLEQDNPVALPNEKIIIYDANDTILFSTNEKGVIAVDKSLLLEIRTRGEIRYKVGDHEVLGFVFTAANEPFVVIAAATDIYGSKRLKNLVYILLIVFAISIVIASISAWFYAGKALQPIARVVDQVSEISISSLNLRVDEGNGKDEISRLARTFNSMLSRLETSFLTQKNFIANASHELRTPLTVITGQLEVTLMNSRSETEYKNVIQSVLDDIRNLNNLSNKLLLLAQSTSGEREKRMSMLRVDELIWQAKEDLLKVNPEYVINIDMDQNVDDESHLTIRGDAQLIKAAVVNLIENGCKYSDTKTISVFIQATQSIITITFADNGIGIPQSDLQNIFEPFYRAGNTQKIKGHGIGLSMVRAIVRLHQGTIDLKSKVGEGTTVTLTFPV